MISDEQRAWLRDTILANFGFDCPDCPSTSTCTVEDRDDATVVTLITVNHQPTCPAPVVVRAGSITFAERQTGPSGRIVNVEQGPRASREIIGRYERAG